MKGVIVTGLTKQIKNSDLQLSEIRKAIQETRTEFANLSRLIRNPEIRFLVDDLYQEIILLNNINRKLVDYRNFLNSVLSSYQQQDYQISAQIRQVTP